MLGTGIGMKIQWVTEGQDACPHGHSFFVVRLPYISSYSLCAAVGFRFAFIVMRFVIGHFSYFQPGLKRSLKCLISMTLLSWNAVFSSSFTVDSEKLVT